MSYYKQIKACQNTFGRNLGEEMIKTKQMYEGTIVAAGWDRFDDVNQSSLFTKEDEDILLDHGLGMKVFKDFLNHRVRVWGDIESNGRNERRINVKKIIKIIDHLPRSVANINIELSDQNSLMSKIKI